MDRRPDWRERAWWLAIAAAVGLAIVAASKVQAKPPAGTDPNSPISQWFNSLVDPINRVGCCGEADCRPTEARQTPAGHWEAVLDPKNYPDYGLTDSEWLTVPDDRILRHTENPVGRAVMCWMPGEGILCFVPPYQA
jgi:hypothetical protein